jgi:hypothetical protein
VWNRLVAAGLLAAVAVPAGAQSAPPAKPDGNAEAAAAMERAQRLAANPLRVILQAGKIKRRVEPDASAAVPVVAAATVAGTSAVARPPVAEAPQPALMTLASKAPAAMIFEPVAALESAPLLSAPALPQTAAPTARPDAGPVRPRVVTMVEPEVPAQLLADVGRAVEVKADLSLRPDGSVAEVSLVGPYPRNWQRYLLAALTQWRFAPLPGPWVHRVELVFNQAQ